MPTAAVIIPAHDEESVLGESLRALGLGPAGDAADAADAVDAQGLEVVVVCNGCTDRTAEVARGFAGVRVLETPVASKARALQLGDDAATVFPRVYSDADVRLGRDVVARMVEALDGPEPRLAAPRPAVDLTGCDPWVRAFYAAWERTPYYRAGMVGCGVYGMSEAGRRRFGRWPEVVADDRFARSWFSAAERVTVDGTVRVRAPRTVADLIRAKTRSRLGVLELDRVEADRGRADHGEKDRGGTFAALFANPLRWPSSAVYLGIKWITDRRARRQLPGRLAGRYVWERDASTRS